MRDLSTSVSAETVIKEKVLGIRETREPSTSLRETFQNSVPIFRNKDIIPK
jgi:hypothetical protein